jgi:hypothetical protein
MSRIQSRHFKIGGRSIEIVVEGDDLAEAVYANLAMHASPQISASDGGVLLEISENPQTSRRRGAALYEDHRKRIWSRPNHVVCEVIAKRGTHEHAYYDFLLPALVELLSVTGAFALHAGAVSLQGGSNLLVVGTSGSGKSTLVADLLACGSTIFTDDIVFIDGSSNAYTLWRPIHVNLAIAELLGISPWLGNEYLPGSGKYNLAPGAIGLPNSWVQAFRFPVAVLHPFRAADDRTAPVVNRLSPMLAAHRTLRELYPGATTLPQDMLRDIAGRLLNLPHIGVEYTAPGAERLRAAIVDELAREGAHEP